MKKSASLLLIAALATSALSVSATAFAQTPSSQEKTQVIVTVVDSITQGENQLFIRRPNNGGQALKITDAMSFSEAKLRKLEVAQKSRSAIQLVIKGTTIVDIL